MKKISLISVLLSMLFVLSINCFAFDIGGKPASFGIKGGLHMPLGDYEDVVDDGFTFGGQMTVPIDNMVSWGISLSFNMADASYGSGDISMIEFLPYINYYPVRSEKADLFLRGGLGLNYWEWDWDFYDHGRASDDGTDLMIALGGGVNFAQHFEILALYNRVFTPDDDIDYFNLTFGYNF